MHFSELLTHLDHGTPCVWVAVARARGSVPRDEGAGMVVTAVAASGTIGGGHLELKAIELAREWMRLGHTGAMQRHYPLGPALGQCCGGAVDLLFRPVTAAERVWVAALADAEAVGGDVALTTRLDAGAAHTALALEADCAAIPLASITVTATPAARGANTPTASGIIVTRYHFDPWPIWVFGAGHVGKALVQVLSTLPCRVTWVDSRDAEFPATQAHNVHVLLTDHPADEVNAIPAGADVLVLTHSHALDLEIVMQLVRRADLAYLGVIGSATKAQLFRRRLEARGLNAQRMVCPIGVAAGVESREVAATLRKNKHPGAIALGVAADLLARRDALSVASPIAATPAPPPTSTPATTQPVAHA